MLCSYVPLALIALASSSAPPPAPADPATRAIDAYCQPLVARGDLSGQLMVLRSGRVVIERSFGKADAELGVAVTPETRFNIASVTKPMTTVITIQLIDAKRIGLRDSIARWLPGFPKGDSIRIEHLLQHSSGIPHEVVPDSEMTRPYSAAQVVERAKRMRLDFSPGSRSSYSSGGFEVLARILEIAGGKSYGELLDERILAPLGMSHTIHGDSRALLPGRAAGYVPGPRGIENAPLQDFSALVGAGSVWSTSRDIHRFVNAVVTGSLGANIRTAFVRDGRLDFNGRTGGFKAWAMWDSTTGVEAIFLGNVASGAPDQLKRDILRIASGQSVAPPALPALRTEALPIDELRRWEGVYQIENGPRLELRVKDGALYTNDWVMLPTKDGGLFSPRDYGTVRAGPDLNGKPSRIDWTQGTQVYPAKRVAD